MEEAWEYSAVMRLVVITCLALFLWTEDATAADRHAGYYYPEPKNIETYRARARVLSKSSRANRLAFINGLTAGLLKRPYPPQISIFAKGLDAQKMIIVSNFAGKLDTIYRARALFATMTAVARKSPIFKQFNVETILTFFDLAKMLGFKQITISDGDTFSHQVLLR